MKMGGWVVYFPETLLSPVFRGDAWFILEVNFVAELFIILPLHVVIFSYAMLLLRIFHTVIRQYFHAHSSFRNSVGQISGITSHCRCLPLYPYS